jgi:hypothetical protein
VVERRRQQVAELAQRVLPDRGLLIVADQRADVALVGVDVEMVEPKLG